MKLKSIITESYEGLEDADEFSNSMWIVDPNDPIWDDFTYREYTGNGHEFTFRGSTYYVTNDRTEPGVVIKDGTIIADSTDEVPWPEFEWSALDERPPQRWTWRELISELCDIYSIDIHNADELHESYEGLEDADEFSFRPNCEWCGNPGDTHHTTCQICGDDVTITACDDCERTVKNTIESGVWCDKCWESRLINRPTQLHESYEGLEDADEFEDEDNFDYCDNCLASDRELAYYDEDLHPCNNCHTLYCTSCIPGGRIYELTKNSTKNVRHHQYCNHNGQIGRMQSDESGNTIFIPKDFVMDDCDIIECPACGPITESYEGLEDADEFGRNEPELTEDLWRILVDRRITPKYYNHQVNYITPDNKNITDEIRNHPAFDHDKINWDVYHHRSNKDDPIITYNIYTIERGDNGVMGGENTPWKLYYGLAKEWEYGL